MGVVANEPSMEDILSSIKRIIADGSERPQGRVKRRSVVDRDDDAMSPADDAATDFNLVSTAEDPDATILELTEMVEEPALTPPTTTEATPRKTAKSEAAAPAPILSDSSAQAARQSLSQLSSLLVRPDEGESNTLEGLVREMLRPMLKDWLEAKLPDLVEGMVKKEIDRIVGRLG